ncbi:uncharacterized protein LACBIDRAFT_333003 [Laccaria bicolor S238N-H82]|uniref:Predicted protein n=1 Tax=Laccaria bicolor (strain S238N-H82 / ATCC MYA-4686) TaxID=486041 RepID=B0DUH9_LACBS|nr:uncharacterized protein LACBIDRAFT_333003 [Laccaria bicolor S238N-H82]EDR01743.1 predicted protein [Laccaria bicolor S238N-H82]|eukprot:XP_001887556.1 predicted protein [Laccaria bicolor S238N-H82]
MSNNNPTGINGHGVKNYPDDETLKASLFQYAKEKLTTAQRLARLEAEHNLVIKAPTLYKLSQKFNVPSVRRLPPADIATQAVLENVANDPSQGRGVGTIGTLLSNQGMPLPRIEVFNGFRDFIRNAWVSMGSRTNGPHMFFTSLLSQTIDSLLQLGTSTLIVLKTFSFLTKICCTGTFWFFSIARSSHNVSR